MCKDNSCKSNCECSCNQGNTRYTVITYNSSPPGTGGGGNNGGGDPGGEEPGNGGGNNGGDGPSYGDIEW